MNQALQGNLWGKMNPETLVHKTERIPDTWKFKIPTLKCK